MKKLAASLSLKDISKNSRTHFTSTLCFLVLCFFPMPSLAATESSSVCSLTHHFTDTHAAIEQLGHEALSLISSSRKHGDGRWLSIRRRADMLLASFSTITLALDDVGDNAQKRSITQLIQAYTNVLILFVDYAKAAVEYERDIRAQTSSNDESFQSLDAQNSARYTLDERTTQIGDALRSLQLPEQRYNESCFPHRVTRNGSLFLLVNTSS